jgi:hypothetical protein
MAAVGEERTWSRERWKSTLQQEEVPLRLTKRGRIAFREHQEFHTRMDSDIINLLGRQAVREQDFLSELFGNMALYLGRAIKERTPEMSSDRPSESMRGKL